MDRGERIGLAAAVAGHVVLFGLLSVGFLATPNPVKLHQQAVDVSLVKDVALESAAPKPAPAAPSVAPEHGLPEEAAPPAPTPEPTPAPPQPAPAPAKPAPPEPAPPKPAPKPAPAPKPVPSPTPKPQPAKPAPAKSAPAKPAAAKPEPAPAKPAPAKPARPATKPASGTNPAATAARPRGSRLGPDFLKGLSDQPTKNASPAAAPAAKMGAQQAADIGQAIRRQVQPCANRQVTPGPGAERIQVTINLRLNRDGSLAARPRVTGHAGVDDENQRYVARVDDLAINTFVGCAPLTGLPAELYDVQNGWSNFSLRYKLPG